MRWQERTDAAGYISYVSDRFTIEELDYLENVGCPFRHKKKIGKKVIFVLTENNYSPERHSFDLETLKQWAEKECKKECTPTLTLDASDMSELFFAFRDRGYSSTRVKVAEFLRELDRNHGREPHEGDWYYRTEGDSSSPEYVVRAIVDYENNADEFWTEFRNRVAQLDRQSELAQNCKQLLLMDQVDLLDSNAKIAFTVTLQDTGQ